MASLLRLTGRKKEHPIWDYFKYDNVRNVSFCQVKTKIKKVADGVECYEKPLCGEPITGVNSTNLQSHLSTHKSSEEYKEFLVKVEKWKQDKDIKEKKTVMATKSDKIENFFNKKSLPANQYHSNSAEYQRLNCAVVKYFARSSDPTKKASDPAFRELMHEFQPKFVMPGTKGIEASLKKREITAHAYLRTQLAATRRVTICLDIWSKKFLSASFLGILACYYNREAGISEHTLLTLSKADHPHTGSMIADCLKAALEYWNISADKIIVIITDNGSNMIKALKLMNEEAEATEQSQTEDGENSNANESNEAESEGDNDTEDEDGHTVTEAEGREDDDEVDEIVGAITNITYSRMACLPHTLQLIIKELDKQKSCSQVVTKASSVVKKVRMSSVAVQDLIQTCGKTLIACCPTRWNSKLLMLKRLLDVKEHIIRILDKHGIDGLLASEWALIEDICKLLEPFGEYTNMLQADAKALSFIVPSILDLDFHLQNTTHCKTAASAMLKNLQARFAWILDPNAADFNPIPIAASLLDPTVPKFLMQPGKESFLAAAKRYILLQVRHCIES